MLVATGKRLPNPKTMHSTYLKDREPICVQMTEVEVATILQ